MERSSGSLLAVLKQKKIPGNICFSEQIFHRKQSLDAPEQTNKQTNKYIWLSASSKWIEMNSIHYEVLKLN